MPKYLIIILLFTRFLASASSPPQIVSSEIGINGLTCSLCSQSVEYALKQLPFIDKVEMNLSETTALIYFKGIGRVAPDQIAKAVQDAGFSLRYLNLNVVFDQQEEPCIEIASYQYYLLSTEQQTLNGTISIQLLHQDFLSRKVFKQWKEKLQNTTPCHTTSNTYFAALL
ncbi:heavy-metal-associated domain-containing protein [Sediminitomix flava]|uniref:Copper chaperone CopZ n=1 Tax=Sediminitomix flava TaxID=379075 RepID=A0A315ZU79_SEDFL|nr:cation transporter [Sediminitomix flava]PWJ39189.1 copper chaperone CopZ [Sediminitomix flava]